MNTRRRKVSYKGGFNATLQHVRQTKRIKPAVGTPRIIRDDNDSKSILSHDKGRQVHHGYKMGVCVSKQSHANEVHERLKARGVRGF